MIVFEKAISFFFLIFKHKVFPWKIKKSHNEYSFESPRITLEILFTASVWKLATQKEFILFNMYKYLVIVKIFLSSTGNPFCNRWQDK